ncbi:MAG: hypothetical protein IPG74_04015 [Flavobacteriales bacterium]|nr:hypothetical protein [Flavobacteriales bacterium]
MKKTILSFLLIGSAASLSAQCTPDPLYQDSLFGVWPDTIEDFAPGSVGVSYSDQMDLIIPDDAGDIDPNLAGTMIDSVRMDSIQGMPPGLSIACNSHTGAPCTYLSATLGCGVIQGVPTVAGSYPLTIHVTGYSQLFGFPPRSLMRSPATRSISVQQAFSINRSLSAVHRTFPIRSVNAPVSSGTCPAHRPPR